MNLLELSSLELIKTEGGEGDVLVTGGNGSYYDDGSGQGCIRYPKGFSPAPYFP